jgi:phospholipid/cholesterol/gamma-HCH transport system permease protein
MALLTGYQLAKFGTERLVPTLISIAFTRELGPLLTGIVLAARIGAAFTAELGTMQVAEEVEAIEAMGIGPLRLLVAPRLVAITGLMPCLSVCSVIAGLLGSALISWITLNLVPAFYFDAVLSSLLVKDIVIGLLKAAFFGLVIGLIACFKGLTVTGGAELPIAWSLRSPASLDLTPSLTSSLPNTPNERNSARSSRSSLFAFWGQAGSRRH